MSREEGRYVLRMDGKALEKVQGRTPDELQHGETLAREQAARKVLDRVKDVEQISRRYTWRATCPAHMDRARSLVVRAPEGQPRVQIRCHAGCGLDAVLQALGMEMADLEIPKVAWYLTGVGYGAPGKPVPYGTTDIREAKVYKSERGVKQAQEKYGGTPVLVRVDENEVPVAVTGKLK